MKILLVSLILTIVLALTLGQGIFDYSLQDYDGNDVPLSQYKISSTKVILIVNIADNDGHTFHNNKELDLLYSKYKDKLMILAITSNDFSLDHHQSPSNPILGMIPVFAQISLTGATRHPLIDYLVDNTDSMPINWNYHKFLINAANGKPINHYTPNINPMKIEPDILKYLNNGKEL